MHTVSTARPAPRHRRERFDDPLARHGIAAGVAYLVALGVVLVWTLL